ncbi:uncharacterized protein PHALS_14531 [Plasmopara halstedii]|uniref:Uncharacterized protein n=1 Tax=Plasmopara halstedii TaxID=4781 RepID=A0A0P1AKP7_PLAHL|nr:uncharacterized protein PHALS_14531 [Plasmopara halstedii]CEG41421.1 hypothetical protein PHALS_14531 [Plasmopara halstedii]|eukprot:XP_024577790.1 hypothetical protein PHALS_14531 [Plasmopara halstedii]
MDNVPIGARVSIHPLLATGIESAIIQPCTVHIEVHALYHCVNNQAATTHHHIICSMGSQKNCAQKRLVQAIPCVRSNETVVRTDIYTPHTIHVCPHGGVCSWYLLYLNTMFDDGSCEGSTIRCMITEVCEYLYNLTLFSCLRLGRT